MKCSFNRTLSVQLETPGSNTVEFYVFFPPSLFYWFLRMLASCPVSCLFVARSHTGIGGGKVVRCSEMSDYSSGAESNWQQVEKRWSYLATALTQSHKRLTGILWLLKAVASWKELFSLTFSICVYGNYVKYQVRYPVWLAETSNHHLSGPGIYNHAYSFFLLFCLPLNCDVFFVRVFYYNC